MAELLRDLPTELYMATVPFTPHPCATILREFYASDDWFARIQRRAGVLYELDPAVGLDSHLLALLSVLRFG